MPDGRWEGKTRPGTKLKMKNNDAGGTGRKWGTLILRMRTANMGAEGRFEEGVVVSR